MNNITGIEAIRLATETSKLPDANFVIAFYPYNSTKGIASTTLRTIPNCKVRKQLPQDRFIKDSENFFLFEDEHGNPKMCYRILIRFIGFSLEHNQLRKVTWT